MKKLKFLLIIATLLLSVTALCVCANAEIVSGYCGAEGDGTNLTWTLDTATGVLEINGTGEMKNYNYYSPYYAPWYSYRSSVKSVTLGDGVTSIGNYAFYSCSALTSVSMPNVSSIGYATFKGCYALTSVSMPNVISIGRYAFEYCSALTSVDIPKCTTSIGSEAFEDCTSLESITVDDANTKYSSDNFGVLFNKDKSTLIQYPIGNSRTSYFVPSTVTTIGSSAFYNCDALTSVDMPNVSSIGYAAFFSCSALTSVDMPKVTSIGSQAFAYCKALTSVEISECTTSIGSYAFRYCSKLKKATIYSKTATFDSYVFDDTHADFEIHGYKGSTAETYAEKNSHPFVEIAPSISFNATNTSVYAMLGTSTINSGGTLSNGGFIVDGRLEVILISEDFFLDDITWSVSDESVFEITGIVDGTSEDRQTISVKTHKLGTTTLTASLPDGTSISIDVEVIPGSYIELTEQYDTDYLYCNGAFLNSENELTTTPEFYVSIKNAARTGSVSDDDEQNTIHNVKLKATVSGSNMSFEKGSYKNTYESLIPELKLNEALADLLLLYPYNVNENTFKEEKTFTVSIEISCDELTETYTDTMSFDVKNYVSYIDAHINFINNSSDYNYLKENLASIHAEQLKDSFDYNYNNILYNVVSFDGIVEGATLEKSDVVVSDMISGFLSSPQYKQLTLEFLIQNYAESYETLLNSVTDVIKSEIDIATTLPGAIDDAVLGEYLGSGNLPKTGTVEKMLKVNKHSSSGTKFKDQDWFTALGQKVGESSSGKTKLGKTFDALDKVGYAWKIAESGVEVINEIISGLNYTCTLNAYCDADKYQRNALKELYDELCITLDDLTLASALGTYIHTNPNNAFSIYATEIKMHIKAGMRSAYHLVDAIFGDHIVNAAFSTFGNIALSSGATLAGTATGSAALSAAAGAFSGYVAGKLVSDVLCSSDDWAAEMAMAVELGALAENAHTVLLRAEAAVLANKDEESVKEFESILFLYQTIQCQSINHIMNANTGRAFSVIGKIMGWDDDVIVVNNELADHKYRHSQINCHGDITSVASLSPATESVKIIQIACPVNVFVYDADGGLLTQIENDEIVFEAPGIVVSIFNDVKFIIVPANEEFTVEIVATDDGEMNYSVSEYDSGELVRVVNYSDISLYEGQEFDGNINAGYDIAAHEYNLSTTNKDNQPVSVNNLEELTQTNLNALSVEVICEGNGSAIGVDSATKGDYVVVVATPDDGYKFKGWYNGSNRVSKEESYGFNIESDIVLTAKFSLSGVTPGDANGDDIINIRDITLILQHIAGWEVDIDESAADVTGDGSVNIRDVTLILQHIAGWDVTLG